MNLQKSLTKRFLSKKLLQEQNQNISTHRTTFAHSCGKRGKNVCMKGKILQNFFRVPFVELKRSLGALTIMPKTFKSPWQKINVYFCKNWQISTKKFEWPSNQNMMKKNNFGPVYLMLGRYHRYRTAKNICCLEKRSVTVANRRYNHSISDLLAWIIGLTKIQWCIISFLVPCLLYDHNA